jgi:hypothetical protein
MVNYLGYIYRFTSKRGEQAQGIVVDCHPNMGLYGVRMDNKDSNVTLWIHLSGSQLGTTHELLSPDAPIQWRNPRLCHLIHSGEVAKMIEASRWRLADEQEKPKTPRLHHAWNTLSLAAR